MPTTSHTTAADDKRTLSKLFSLRHKNFFFFACWESFAKPQTLLSNSRLRHIWPDFAITREFALALSGLGQLCECTVFFKKKMQTNWHLTEKSILRHSKSEFETPTTPNSLHPRAVMWIPCSCPHGSRSGMGIMAACHRLQGL